MEPDKAIEKLEQKKEWLTQLLEQLKSKQQNNVGSGSKDVRFFRPVSLQQQIESVKKSIADTSDSITIINKMVGYKKWNY